MLYSTICLASSPGTPVRLTLLVRTFPMVVVPRPIGYLASRPRPLQGDDRSRGIVANVNILVVPPARLERASSTLGPSCVVHLSYGGQDLPVRSQ